MSNEVVDEKTFIELFEKVGCNETARRLGIHRRNVLDRRARIENRIGRQITPPSKNQKHATVGKRAGVDRPRWIERSVHDGVVLMGSDAHYWPGIISTAHRAFVHFAKKLLPKIIVMNGDALDGASISRFQSIGWENKPTLVDELKACQERLGEIEKVRGNAELIWPAGNHDGRFETRLATVAPEYAKIHGYHLKDFFPYWVPCWAIKINDNVVIKHRYKGGMHAPHNNTLFSGMNIFTGHLHQHKVSPISDYNGRRYGVDLGTMAAPYGPQFESYTEQNPLNWAEGFGVATFKNGELLPPELVTVLREGVVTFRGEVIAV